MVVLFDSTLKKFSITAVTKVSYQEWMAFNSPAFSVKMLALSRIMATTDGAIVSLAPNTAMPRTSVSHYFLLK
jgi:hypothetical protein